MAYLSIPWLHKSQHCASGHGSQAGQFWKSADPLEKVPSFHPFRLWGSAPVASSQRGQMQTQGPLHADIHYLGARTEDLGELPGLYQVCIFVCFLTFVFPFKKLLSKNKKKNASSSDLTLIVRSVSLSKYIPWLILLAFSPVKWVTSLGSVQGGCEILMAHVGWM